VDALKPDRRAFEHLCRVLECDAEEVIFVGDDLDYDVRGSISAGLKGVWLNRDRLDAPEGIHTQIQSLKDLHGLL
jgi:putative hydrolase of the HAD superfamily